MEKAKADGRDIDWIDGNELYEWWLTGKRRRQPGNPVNTDQHSLFAIDSVDDGLLLYE